MRKAEDAQEQKAVDDVARHGWHVLMVLEDEKGPGFAYTLGLQYSFQHPELIVFGLSPDTAHAVLNTAGEAIRRGARYVSGGESDELLAGRPCRFRDVPATQYQNYVGWNLWFYDGPEFRVLQIVWPDKSGRWPWESGVHPWARANQPILEDHGNPAAPSAEYSMITIEFEDPRISTCECCGGRTTRLTRFVYRNGDAYAVYYAAFSDNHPEQHVSLIVSIGEWGNDAPPSQRVAFPIRLWEGNEDLNVTITDAAESPWRDAEILGRVLDRNEALAHPQVQEVFYITDRIFAEDQPIKDYFKAAG